MNVSLISNKDENYTDELNERQITRVPGKKMNTKMWFVLLMTSPDSRRVLCNLINKTIQIWNYQSLGNKETESYTRIRSKPHQL